MLQLTFLTGVLSLPQTGTKPSVDPALVPEYDLTVFDKTMEVPEDIAMNVTFGTRPPARPTPEGPKTQDDLVDNLYCYYAGTSAYTFQLRVRIEAFCNRNNGRRLRNNYIAYERTSMPEYGPKYYVILTFGKRAGQGDYTFDVGQCLWHLSEQMMYTCSVRRGYAEVSQGGEVTNWRHGVTYRGRFDPQSELLGI